VRPTGRGSAAPVLVDLARREGGLLRAMSYELQLLPGRILLMHVLASSVWSPRSYWPPARGRASFQSGLSHRRSALRSMWTEDGTLQAIWP
jgi:hypothetical protein